MDKGRRLIFFIGNSGSGKDLVMRTALSILIDEKTPASIVKRWITRPQHESESFHSVSEREFFEARDKGKFALWWHIYGLYYGVPKSITEQLTNGEVILCNISRRLTFEAKRIFPESKLVLVDVPKEIAVKRVRKRGREKGKELNIRIQRMDKKIDTPIIDLVLKNDCHISECVDVLMEFLKAI